MKFDTDNTPSIHQIMDLTGVSERTARRWLRHGAPVYAVRYIELHLTGRVMPRDWPAHWHYNHKGLLETDSCHPAMRWQHLTWYQYVIQGWYESLRVIAHVQGQIDYLAGRLPRAEVIELEAYRAELAAIQARDPTRAALAMQEHLQGTEELLQQLERRQEERD
jgi:hypothetical protein